MPNYSIQCGLNARHRYQAHLAAKSANAHQMHHPLVPDHTVGFSYVFFLSKARRRCLYSEAATQIEEGQT